MTQPMSLDEALALLGLTRASSDDAALSAYRAHAAVLHPDQVKGMTQDEADRLLDELDEAWFVVEAHLEERTARLTAGAAPPAAAVADAPVVAPPGAAPPPGLAPPPTVAATGPGPGRPMTRREWRAAKRQARAAQGRRTAHPVLLVVGVVAGIVAYRVVNAIVWGLLA